jgi:23S rRNA (uracil1939-C5)-methyltransferase
MKNNIPVVKNKEYVVTIESMGFQGEGIAKIESFTIFIQGAITGETIKIKVLKVNKNYAFGKIIEVIKASPMRKEPRCNLYDRCGGCNIQHVSYEGQLEYKTKRVIDCITRIGKIKDVIIHHTLGMEDPYGYRNKVQLPVGLSNNSNNNVAIGFYAVRSHEIINMNVCHIQDETSDTVVKLTRRWMKKHCIVPYDEKENSGLVRHIMIRKAFKTGEVMVVIVTNGNVLPDKESFINVMVRNIPGIKSIIQNVNTENTNVVLGNECITLWGEDHIVDYIEDFKFNISPLSFFQVNPVQTEVLYNKALEYADLKGEEVVFDAYCGTGTISLFLSQKAKKVYGVEIVPEAIEDAKENAKNNSIENVEFIAGESEKIIPQLIKDGVRADVVVVDPPRKGCAPELLEAISKMKPETIVYVSCDPATLARDLGILDDLGYKTTEVQPVDMFPQTSHVETVVRLCHQNP